MPDFGFNGDAEVMEELTSRLRSNNLKGLTTLGADGKYGAIVADTMERPGAKMEFAAETMEFTGEPILGISEEALIRDFGRPALLVRNGTFEVPESEVWKLRLGRAKNKLDQVLGSVGRIELRDHDRLDWVGTGWMIREDLIVTNRHVAKVFTAKGGNGLTFKKNSRGRSIEPRIDFREEYQQPLQVEFEITKARFLADDSPDPDVAFLQIEPLNDDDAALPAPIPLASSVNSGSYVAAIGYPAWDGRRNDSAHMHRVFDGIYDVKRLQPGQVMATHGSLFTHDCSTLGGNSGSVVVDLASGEAVGLHFGGRYKRANAAVSSSTLADLVRAL